MNTTPIFISYAREDSQWVQAISASLASKGIHAWVDTNALDYASLWQDEIEDAILRAQLVVVLVTPHFLDSLACRFEVERAERLRKRLLPVIDSRIEEHQIPAALNAYQWFKLNRDTDNANTVAAWIERSINLDPDWLKRHTDLTTRAQQWVNNRKDPSLLLRGKDLASAQAMLEESSLKDKPLGSDLIEMIAVSDQTQSRRRMTLAGFLGGSLLAVIAAASFGYIQHVQAEGEAKSALRNRLNQLAMAGDLSSMLDTAKANAARLEKDPMASLQVRLFQAESLSTNLELKAYEVESLEVKGNWVMLHSFSSGGQLFNLENWNEPRHTANFSEGETHKVSLSDSGNYHAIWTPTQFTIRPSSNPGEETQHISNHANIEHITLLENARQIVIQQASGVAVYPWVPGQTALPQASLQMDGVQLLRAFPNGDLLYRKPPKAGGQFEVWIHQQGSDLLLGRFKGQVLQVLRNQDQVLAIRVKREVHGFQAGKPLGKVWVADESGVALSNRGHSLAVVDPSNEARVLYFSLDDVVVSEGKSLRQDPAALRDDLQENLHALRNGAISIGELHPVFDQDDSRLFAPGEFNRSLSPINAQLIASMDSELGTEGGLSDNILVLGGSGHHLLGLSLNHGGNGTVTLHRFSIPARLQQGRTSAIATTLQADQSGFFALQTHGQLVQQPWVGSPTMLQLPGLETENANTALVAGTLSATGERAWAINTQGELLAWTLQGQQAKLNFKQTIDMDWLTDLNRFRPVSVSKNGNNLLLVGTQGLLLLDANTGKTRCKLEHTEQFYDGMAYFLDEQTLVSVNMLFTNGTGWENRRIQAFDVNQCTPVERFAARPELQENEGYEAGFGFGIQTELGGAPWMADRRFGAKYRIRDLQTGNTLGALSNHSGRILALRAHPATDLLISSDEIGSINIWESSTLRRIKTLDAPQCQAIDLELNNTGTHMLARCANGQTIWWALGEQP
ncbi:TIR domain-containing protein [Limnobacter sp.]|uniref:TIR domain-containing protein n=1 Tax=Limnobacter sp. TaxID=2003368 RepID=UPI002FE0196C